MWGKKEKIHKSLWSDTQEWCEENLTHTFTSCLSQIFRKMTYIFKNKSKTVLEKQGRVLSPDENKQWRNIATEGKKGAYGDAFWWFWKALGWVVPKIHVHTLLYSWCPMVRKLRRLNSPSQLSQQWNKHFVLYLNFMYSSTSSKPTERITVVSDHMGLSFVLHSAWHRVTLTRDI